MCQYYIHANLVEICQPVHEIWCTEALFGLNFEVSHAVTLKIRSRSPKSYQLFIMSQCYIRANLVKIHAPVHEILCEQESDTPAPTGSAPKQYVPLPSVWDIVKLCQSRNTMLSTRGPAIRRVLMSWCKVEMLPFCRFLFFLKTFCRHTDYTSNVWTPTFKIHCTVVLLLKSHISVVWPTLEWRSLTSLTNVSTLSSVRMGLPTLSLFCPNYVTKSLMPFIKQGKWNTGTSRRRIHELLVSTGILPTSMEN